MERYGQKRRRGERQIEKRARGNTEIGNEYADKTEGWMRDIIVRKGHLVYPCLPLLERTCSSLLPSNSNEKRGRKEGRTGEEGKGGREGGKRR